MARLRMAQHMTITTAVIVDHRERANAHTFVCWANLRLGM